MKKTRILAALLTLMMIVCMLPIVQVSAAVPANLPEAIGVVTGTNHVILAPATATAGNMNLDFTASGVDSTAGLIINSGTVDFTADGAVLGTSSSELEYVPTPPDGDDRWSALEVSGMYAFGFKVLSSNGALEQMTQKPGYNNRVFIEANQSSMKLNRATTVDYAPGNDWHDCLVKTNASGGYDVYIKKRIETQFTLLGSTTDFSSGGLWASDGCRFWGRDVAIDYAITYLGVDLSTYNSIDEILGSSTGSTLAIELDTNSSFAQSPNVAGGTRKGGFTSHSAYQVDAEGVTLTNPSDTDSKFTYDMFGAYYSPFNTEPTSGANYSPQALYFKAKGNFALVVAGPNGKGRVDMDVQVGKEINIPTDNAVSSYPLIIQDEWTEYLIVPNGKTVNTDVTDNGYTLYVKAANATEGKWYKVKDYGFKNPSSSYASYGISFYKVTGHIKSIKTLSLTGSVSDAQATPAGADYLYFNEEFDTATDYANKSELRTDYKDGNVVFVATDEGGSNLVVDDLTIPAGGYAEFKAQYNGIASYNIYDGTMTIAISQQCDYATISGGNGNTANDNNTWRTWRITKNSEGTYNIYSKNDGDTGWFVHATNNAGDVNDEAARMTFGFTKRNDGGNGDSKLAYLKVYGPEQNGGLTLIDGYTATPVAEGAELTYPESLRVITTQETGKLCVVSYKSNNTIAELDIFDVAEDFVGGSKVIDLNNYAAAAKVRFFLWEDFGNIENLADVVPTYHVGNNNILY